MGLKKKMKKKKYCTVKNQIKKIVEPEANSVPLTHIYIPIQMYCTVPTAAVTLL